MPTTEKKTKKTTAVTKVKKVPAKKKSSSVKDSGRPKAVKKTAAKKSTSRKKKVEAVEVQKLRIRIQAYENKILDASVKQIIDTAFRYDADLRGPIPLPTEIKKYTVNRASFVFKDAREQFEMRTHKRLVDIINPSAQVIEALTNLSLPSGVNIDVKML